MGFKSIVNRGRAIQAISVKLAAVAMLVLSPQATADVFTYEGAITTTTGAFAALIPAGSGLGGTLTITTNPGGMSTGPADLTNALLKITNPAGGTLFCFFYNEMCLPLETLVPVDSIDRVDLTFAANGCPISGIIDITTFSNTFQIFIPVSLDITNGTLFAQSAGLGTVAGTGMFTSCTGAGGDPEIDPTPDPAVDIDFGSVQAGAMVTPQTITVNNTGSAALDVGPIVLSNMTDFSITADNCSSMSLPATTGSCTLSVTATGATAGMVTSTLTIPSNDADENPVVYNLLANVVTGQISTDQPLIIANAEIGMMSTGTVTVTNTGLGVLTISQIQNTDLVAPFTFVADTCSTMAIPSMGTCTIEVIFTPTMAGDFMDDFTIVSDDPDAADAMLTVNVSASALAPILSAMPNPLAIANTMVNNTMTGTVTISNSGGTADLNVTLAGLVAPFSVTDMTCAQAPIAPDTSCDIEITFTPVATGNFVGMLTIASTNQPVQTEVITITGTGTMQLLPAVTLSEASLSFGSVLIGANGMQTITLTNTGTAALPTPTFTIVGDPGFASSNDCPASLAINSACTITVTFAPAMAGPLAANLSVASIAPGSPHTVALNGTGVTPAPEITIAPASLDMGVVTIGNSSTKMFTVSNDGTADLTVAVVNPVASVYTQTNNCPAMLTPMSFCTVTVVYTPVAAMTDMDTVTVNSNDADEMVSMVAVTGEGVLAPTPNITTNGVTSVSFGTVITSQSGTQTVTLTSNGSADVNVSSITISGINAAEFSSTDTCTGVVVIGADCSVTVTFAPLTAGPKTAMLSVVSDDPTPSAPITLSGTAELALPMAQFSATALILPTAVQGDTSMGTITVTNNGIGDLIVTAIATTDPLAAPLSLTGETCTAAAVTTGNSCVMTFTFAPAMVGNFMQTFNFDSNDAIASRILSLEGSATMAPTPDIMLNMTTLNFGSVLFGATPVQSVTVTNNGDADLIVSAADIAPMSDFTVMNNCTLVMPMQTCTVDVTFAPALAGAALATLTITSDDPDTQMATVTLSGTGVMPEPEITVNPTAADLGSAVIGATTTADIQVTNDGSADLIIGTVTLAGTNAGEFSQSNNCATVTAGMSCTITVTYAPTTAGNATATLTIPSNDADEGSVDVALTGMATVAPMPMISAPASADVGDVNIGASGTTDVTITNNGTANLAISNIAVSGTNAGDFAVTTDSCSSAPVAPMSTCMLTITYSASVAGAASANVTITSNDPANPMTTIAMSGNGVAVFPMGSVSVTDIDFDSVTIGTTGMQSVIITNSGTGVLKITGVTLSGANAADFSAPNVCPTIAAKTNCTLTVSYSPAAVGSGVATLTITTDDPAMTSIVIPLQAIAAAIEEVVVSVTSEGGNGSFGWLELLALVVFVAIVRRRQLTPIIAVLLLAASPAYAADDDKAGFWYLGGSLGTSDGQSSDANIRRGIESAGVTVSTLNVDESDNGSKLYVGYQASERFAIEVGYSDLGTAGIDLQLGSVSVAQLPLVSRTLSENLSLLGAGTHGSVVFKQPFRDAFAVFAKAGLIAWEIETAIGASTSGGGINIKEVESGTDFTFGLGVEAWLGQGAHVGLRAEWERYEFGPHDAELLSIGAMYRF